MEESAADVEAVAATDVAVFAVGGFVVVDGGLSEQVKWSGIKV